MTDAQTEARAIQRYIAPSAGRGAVVQLLKHCDGEWVRYADHATALAAKGAELAEVKAYSIEMLHRKDGQFERAECAEAQLAEAIEERDRYRRLLDLEAADHDKVSAMLAEARKALEAIYTEARSLPAHTSAVTREHVLTSKLAVIRDAARRALEAQGGENG